MSNYKYKITVFTPTYNRAYIIKTLYQSLLCQTFTDFEWLIVDDGFPDNCPAMCDEWALKDSRITVIHKKNGGLSDARNVGMATASGDYISFVDSDDFINPHMYEVMVETSLKSGCQMICCQYQKIFEGEIVPSAPKRVEYKTLDRIQAMSSLIDNSEIQQIVWNKLYSTELIKDIPFEKGKFHEDEFWSYQVIGKTNKVAIVNYVGYNYLQRKDSIMGNDYSVKRIDAIEAKVLRQKYLEDKFLELALEGKINLLFSCLYQGQLALKCLPQQERKNIFKQLETVYKEYPLSLKERKNLSNSHKIWMSLAKFCLTFTCRLRNLCNVGM